MIILLSTSGIKIEILDSLYAYPSFLPTIEKIFAFLNFAYLIAEIKFSLTFFFLLPPPTEKIKIASLFFRFDILSHSTNTLFQPLSFVRAVNSETLSVGA